MTIIHKNSILCYYHIIPNLGIVRMKAIKGRSIPTIGYAGVDSDSDSDCNPSQ